jgi:hypothetical protein
MSAFSKKVGNGQARKDGPQSSKDRDANPSLTGKIERQKELIRNAPNGDVPMGRREFTRGIFESMSPEARAEYAIYPSMKLEETLAKNPFKRLLEDGDRVRLKQIVNDEHPEVGRDYATLEQRIWSFEGLKKLSPKGSERYEQDKANWAKLKAQGPDATK